MTCTSSPDLTVVLPARWPDDKCMNTSTCQHCGNPVYFGKTEMGFKGFVHEANGLAACPAPVETTEAQDDAR